MGQYWLPVNLDKREYIDPHKLGAGLKLWEQLASHPGTGAALTILCAAMPETRGGGDLDLEENWHGPERQFPQHNVTPAPMPESYPEIAASVIGRWAGDRIVLLGDYAEAGDILKTNPGFTRHTGEPEVDESSIYDKCESSIHGKCSPDSDDCYHDITDLVAKVIEHELRGKFVGDGWRKFVQDE